MVPHADLAEQAIRMAGFELEQPAQLQVLSDYTHLVIYCYPVAGASWSGAVASGTSACPEYASSAMAVVIKFWRNDFKQSLDAFVHRLADTIVPVPAILGIGHLQSPYTGFLTPRFPVERGEPLAFTVYRAIDNAQPAASLETRWDRSTVRAAYRQAGRWLGRLHSLRKFERAGPLARFVDGWQGTADDWYGFLMEQIDRWDRKLARYDISRAHRRLRRLVRDWLLEQKRCLAAVDRYVLCHRDFSFRNILAHREGRLAAVIDFEHALAADPVFDWHRVAARLLCLRPDQEAWLAFLDGYQEGYGVAEDDWQGTSDPLATVRAGCTNGVAARLVAYLAFYAIGGIDYALQEDDANFYKESTSLLEWVAQALT